MIGNSYQIGLLNGLLKQAQQRHKVISQNIANVNTPGYRSKDVTFDEALQSIRNGTDLKPEDLRGKIVHSPGLNTRADGNNVSIDRELGMMAKNSMQFEAYSQILLSKMSMLRSAITGQ